MSENDWRIEPMLLALPIQQQELDRLESTATQSKYRCALGVSVLIHVVVFVLLLSARIEPPLAPRADNNAILLRLVPPKAPAPRLSDDNVIPEPLPTPEVPTRQRSLVDVPIVAPTINITMPLPSENTTTPEAPSTMQLRQIVESISSAQESNSQRLTCTPAQRRSEFFDCPDDTLASGYTAPSNASVDFFNQRSRGVSEQRQNSERMRQIAGSLNATGLDTDEVDSFMQVIDISRQELNTSTNARVNGLRDQMLMNDSTHQLKKLVLNP